MSTHRGTVIITGGSGLIGSALALALRDRYHVVAFDNAGLPHPPPGVDTMDVDLTSESSVAGALDRVEREQGSRIESVVHLAAYYDFSGRPSPKYGELTVGGTERMLRLLRDRDVGQFVFASTSLVYGPTEPGRPQAEDAPLAPMWAYPESKAAAELVVQETRGSIPTVIVRIAAVYDEEGHSPPLANHLQRVAERWFIGRFYPGDPAHGQSFVHREDLIDALARVVDRRAQLPPDLVLNLSAETVAYGDIQHALGLLLHAEDWKTRPVPKVIARAGARFLNALPGSGHFIQPWMINIADDHIELDASRARELLDWDPRRTVRETLPAMVANFRADPETFYRVNKLTPPSRLPKPAGSPTPA
ncbi:NAD(P)-dependent oxidoreductase [Paludisphaera sp.]|uniref:NAD-dependent epimerase/dehydratase family protein n=1 Tax=Paludisphaera sp. TaxID=2017432 RepID=UPI00301C85EF